eukprot:scaffold248464_cov119-Cyclotella_meneghiniana.AAC.1
MQEAIMSELNADMIDEELNDETYDGINRRVSQESVTSSGSIRSDSGTGLALKRLFSKKGNIEQKEGASLKPQSSSLHRRYGRGDHVLITNHDLPDSSLKLVNLHGFAEWDAGEALTSEEGRGPYSYLLAEVKNIHFQENLPYYTVTRIDTGEDQRADVDCMEPITNERNIEAAKRAASKRQRGNPGIDRYKGIKTRLYRRLNKLGNRRKRIQMRIKKQLDACLNGNRPYSCTCRFTGINNTFVRIKGRDGVWSIKRSRGLIIPQGRLPREKQNAKPITESILIKETAHSAESEELLPLTISTVGLSKKQESSDEIHLTNASKIGTALLTTNAQRVATLFEYKGGTNQQVWTSVELLQENNIATNASDEDSCEYLNGTVYSWVAENLIEHGRTDDELYLHLISVVIRPARCAWQTDILSVDGCKEFCTVWPTYDPEQLYDYAMRHFDIRPSMTVSTKSLGYGPYILQNGTLGLTVFILLALSVIRYDAGRLVLNPLRRMLKIVAACEYAKLQCLFVNPLAPPPQKTSSFRDRQKSSDKLGTFETEQLINTVTKITDLLRKCWGTAGADIISSNLARQEGGLSKIASYNPTVPGKAVYALFAFVAIDNYKSYLHNLQGDIIILINDVAAILHEEVYRWGYEDKGQCNKNLGSAFLMVRTLNEVLENRKKAEQVIFSSVNTPAIRRKFTHRRIGSTGSRSNSTGSSKMQHPRNRSSVMVDNIDLSSLPGIQAFADRALLGLLKTFASIHRDRTILKWNEDFRIGSSVELFFGMDAGWAVEGAVGSSYKIDATYLSPHVNMASRMMSATKQYGLFLLISEKVESLLSPGGQKSLRHIDTVTVKGSSLQQKIFTFDMKVRNDFFLYSKSENQADLDSERYSPAIWSTDQDLCAMRNHISDDFLVAFNKGRDEYLSGRDWKKAIEYLKHADKIMCKREVDEGYSESTENIREHMYSLTNVFDRGTSFSDSEECRRRLQMGDGPCQRLIEFMLEHRGEAPPDWEGYRPLTSK